MKYLIIVGTIRFYILVIKMGANILIKFINCSLLIGEILSPFNLHDLKWQILLSSPELAEMITLWKFSSKYLSNMPIIIEYKYLSIASMGRMIAYNNRLNINMFKNYFDFKNSTEFMNFFDICMYAYSIYFNILDSIAHIFDVSNPKRRVFFEFSNILKNIEKNGDNYEIKNDVCIIPNIKADTTYTNSSTQKTIVTTKSIDIEIKIKSCGKIPEKFVGSFNKIKEFILLNKNNDLFALDFIIGSLVNEQKELNYDCLYVRVK